jgi:hypothetical protein
MEFLNGVKKEFLPGHPYSAKGERQACLAKKFLPYLKGKKRKE